MALYGAETWTLRAVDQEHLESFEMWCWRRMEKISWTDHVRKKKCYLESAITITVILLSGPSIREWLRGTWRLQVSFDRVDTGVRTQVLRVWNESESYLCVVRRTLLLVATVNCRCYGASM
jgi:hypothetical protein